MPVRAVFVFPVSVRVCFVPRAAHAVTPPATHSSHAPARAFNPPEVHASRVTRAVGKRAHSSDERHGTVWKLEHQL